MSNIKAYVEDHIVTAEGWEVHGHSDMIPPFNFLITDDPDEALDLMGKIVSQNEIVGMDTETNSLEWEMPTTSMHGFSMAGENSALYVHGRACLNSKVLDYLSWLVNNHQTAWYNINYDLHILEKHGVVYEWNGMAHDVYIMARLNNRGDNFSDGGLKGTAFTYLDHENLPSFKKYLNKYKGDINEIPMEILGRYGAFDARITYDLFIPIRKILQTEIVYGRDRSLWDFYTEVHLRATEGTYRMERNGMYIDTDFLTKVDAEALVVIEDTGAFWQKATGCNMNSSRQKGHFFFDVMGHKSNKKTASGKASTEAGIMRDLALDGDIWAGIYIHTIAPANKIRSTYTKPILDRTNRIGVPWIHGSFSIPRARTGRTACVPTTSQALTESGWKSYHDLNIGDKIMGFDILKEEYTWTNVKNIHVGRDYVGLIKTNRGHETRYNKGIYCTGNHRWVIKHKQSNIIGFGYAENKNQYYNTLLQNDTKFPEPSSSILNPEQAFLYGWYLTDGWKIETSSGRVAMETHLVKERSIKFIEDNCSGYTKSEYENKTRFYFGVNEFDTVYSTAKNMTPSELIMNLSQHARQSMLSAMLEADGSKRKNNERYDRFACERGGNKRVNEYFEVLATSLGIIWTATNKVLPSKKYFMSYNLHKSTERYKQDNKWRPEHETTVWCPETSCGTWIMKQGDEVVITGNSSDPNLQNIPAKGKWGKLMRQAFSAPDGYKFLRVDYSQLELRVLAHFTKDPVWMDMFFAGGDPHQLTGDTVGVTRDQAKVVNFGIIYGMSGKALMMNMKEWGAGNISEQEANEIIDTYFGKFPATRMWMDSVKKWARELGYVQTILGRKRWLPDITSHNTYDRSRAERQAVNTIIQGSAADIMNMGIVNCAELVDNYNAYALLTEDHRPMLLADVVHDEVGIYVPINKHTDALAQRVSKALTTAGEHVGLRVPLIAEPQLGDNWMEVKE